MESDSGPPDAAPGPAAPSHDAFISYSRKDRAFAVALEKALERHPVPKDVSGTPRRLDIFRDEEDLTGTDLYPSIQRHLEDSSRLIVLCTPSARQSQYVNEEIRMFARTRGADAIIPVLVTGIPNNEVTEGREEEMAFPDALFEVMDVPLAADFTGFDPAQHRVGRGEFRDPWFMLLANILGVTREQIEERERKRRLRTVQIFGGAAAAIIVALSAALVLTIQARNEAQEQQRLATEQALVSQATALGIQAQQVSDPTVKLLLGTQAFAMSQRAESIADGVLGRHRAPSHQAPFYDALSQIGDRMSRVTYQGPVYWMRQGAHGEAVSRFSDDGRWLLTGTNLVGGSDFGGCCFVLWYLGGGPDGLVTTPIPADPDVSGSYQYFDLQQVTGNGVMVPRDQDPYAEFSVDGGWLATGHNDRTTQLRRLNDDGSATVVLRHQHDRVLRSFDLSSSGRWLAVSDSVLHLWDLDDPEAPPITHEVADAAVVAVKTDPAGEWLAGATEDGRLALWRLQTDAQASVGSAAGSLDTPEYSIELSEATSLTWSADSRWLAVTASDSVAVIDMRSPGAPPQLFEHQLSMGALWMVSPRPPVFSPTGEFLLTTFGDERHRLHRLDEGPPLQFATQEEFLGEVSFSPSGRWLITGAALFDLEDDRVLGQPGPRVDDPDRGRVFLGFGQSNAIWETALETRQTMRTLGEPGDVPELLSPDGRWMLTTSGRILDLEEPAARARIIPEGERWSFYSEAKFSPDGNWLLLQGQDMAHLRYLDVGQSTDLFGRLPRAESVVATADQRWILTYEEGADHARLWDSNRADAPPSRVMGTEWSGFISMEISASGDWFTTRPNSFDDRTGRVWRRMPDGAFREVLSGDVWDMRFSPDGVWLVVEWYNIGESRTEVYDLTGDDLRLEGVFDSQDGAADQLQTLLQDASAAVRAAYSAERPEQALSPDGRWMVRHEGEEVRLYDQLSPNGGSHLLDSMPAVNTYYPLFSADGRWLAIDTSIWDLQGGAAPYPSYRVNGPGQGSRLFAVSYFSPDSRWAFVYDSQSTETSICSLTALDSEYLRCAILEGTAMGPQTVPALFTRDGHWLVSWGDDGPRLWNLRTSNPAAASLTGLGDPLRFSDDGRWLIQFSDDGRRLERLALDPRLALSQACRAAGRNLSQTEWALYMGDVPYECTCSEFPPGYGAEIRSCEAASGGGN